MISFGGSIALFFLVVVLLGLLFNLSRFKARIPGDIFLDKWGFTIYIPFTSAIIVSAIVSVFISRALH